MGGPLPTAVSSRRGGGAEGAAARARARACARRSATAGRAARAARQPGAALRRRRPRYCCIIGSKFSPTPQNRPNPPKTAPAARSAAWCSTATSTTSSTRTSSWRSAPRWSSPASPTPTTSCCRRASSGGGSSWGGLLGGAAGGCGGLRGGFFKGWEAGGGLGAAREARSAPFAHAKTRRTQHPRPVAPVPPPPSYADTQRHRLGPNYLMLPVNAPRCPARNNHHDGFMNFAARDEEVGLHGLLGRAARPAGLRARRPLGPPRRAPALAAPRLRRLDGASPHCSSNPTPTPTPTPAPAGQLLPLAL
jgi:hypothetical protein